MANVLHIAIFIIFIIFYFFQGLFFLSLQTDSRRPLHGQHSLSGRQFFFSLTGSQALFVEHPTRLVLRRQSFSQKTSYGIYMQTMRVASSPDYTKELRPVSEVSTLCALTMWDGQLEMLRTQLLEQLTLFGAFSNQSQVTQGNTCGKVFFSASFWDSKHRRQRLPGLCSPPVLRMAKRLRELQL